MKVNKKHLSQLLGGSANSWSDLPPLSRGTGERTTLLIFLPQRRPGLGVICWSKFSKEKIFRHLLAKWTVSGFLRKNERLFGSMLILGLKNEQAEILDWIISYQIRKNARRLDLWNELIQVIPNLPKNPKQYLNAFEPEILIQKNFYPKQTFPAKRYIGIGYSDYGTLSTTPAWQEQIVTEESNGFPSVEVKMILSHFVEEAFPSPGPSY